MIGLASIASRNSLFIYLPSAIFAQYRYIFLCYPKILLLLYQFLTAKARQICKICRYFHQNQASLNDLPNSAILFFKWEFELCKSEFITKSDKLFLNCLCYRNSLIFTIHPYIVLFLTCGVDTFLSRSFLRSSQVS